MTKQSPLFVGLYLALAALVTLWLTVFIVYPRQQIAVKRFGQIMRVASQPGLYFKLPFIEQMVIIDDRLRRYDLPKKTVQVRGGAFYEVDAFFTYRITDAKLFLQKVASGQPSTAEEVNLAPRFDDALRAVYGQRDFSAALSSERADMMQEVKQQIENDARSLGITIIDVRILKTDLTEAVSQRIYERMRQEREAVAEKLRARGNEEREKIIAEANRGYEETVAVAARDADIARGQGEAERIDILRDAIAVNPEFYMFWRSQSAYKKVKDLPMVISPDSAFFKYLKNPRG